MNMKNEAIKILKWVECDDLDTLISQKNYRKGVYIIWIYTEFGQEALYIGQGIRFSGTRKHDFSVKAAAYLWHFVA